MTSEKIDSTSPTMLVAAAPATDVRLSMTLPRSGSGLGPSKCWTIRSWGLQRDGFSRRRTSRDEGRQESEKRKSDESEAQHVDSEVLSVDLVE